MYIVNVNAEKIMGKIKPIHGIENSPVVYGSHGHVRLWKKAGFPFARLHDTDYPHGTVVDIPRIFPDFKQTKPTLQTTVFPIQMQLLRVLWSAAPRLFTV